MRKKKLSKSENWDDFEKVAERMRQVQKALGHFPSRAELRVYDSQLDSAINRYGGIIPVRKRMGIQEGWELKPIDHWKTRKAVLDELKNLVSELGHFPTRTEMTDRHLSTLVLAMSKLGGSRSFRVKFAFSIPKVPNGHWDDFANIERILTPLIKKLGHFPSEDELALNGLLSIGNAFKKHGGVNRVRERLGSPILRVCKHDWSDVEQNVINLAKRIGHFPTQSDLNKYGLKGAINHIYKTYGGIIKLRDQLGYGPITDNLLATHANDLAQIVIKLSVPTDRFWATMKERWVVRDLTAAIGEYKETGSVERFRTLLDGE